MTTTKKVSSAAIAAAAASLFALGTMMATPAFAADEGKVKCESVNGCKGMSDCKSGKNECKGQNSCKGQGFKEMSKAECDKAKMEMKKGG